MAGALILRNHYKLDALVMAGAAAYAVGRSPINNDVRIATFGHEENGQLLCSPEAFHCWVVCADWIIDFMAPIFQENLQSSGWDVLVPRRVFQKPFSAISDTLSPELPAGAFHLAPSPRLTQEVLTSYQGRCDQEQLLYTCLEWYRRPPKRMDPVFPIRDERGVVTLLKLQGPEISGSW